MWEEKTMLRPELSYSFYARRMSQTDMEEKKTPGSCDRIDVVLFFVCVCVLVGGGEAVAAD